MRVGKKLNVVEAKKTRSCVVRLEKVRSPPPASKLVRGSTTAVASRTRTGAGPAPPLTEEKTLKGPIKKRPVTQASTPVQAATFKGKEKSKVMSPSAKIAKVTATPQAVSAAAVYETPPTIAAGRSRRAIKPNPKYASDDIVTPKMIKNVATLGAMSASNKKSATSAFGKQRKVSTSSSEDFFNKESSDEDLDLDGIVDKAYNMGEKDDSDSDFSDIEMQLSAAMKKRGRPRKMMKGDEKSTPQQQKLLRTPQLPQKSSALKTSDAVITPTIKSTPSIAKSTPVGTAAKNQPSQLQILRKTLAASVNRIGTQSGATKRKLEPSNDDDNEIGVARKRFTLNTSGTQYKPFGSGVKEIKNLHQSQANKGPIRKSLPSQTLNGGKIRNNVPTSEDEVGATYELAATTTLPTDKRRTLVDTTAAKSVGKPASAASTATRTTLNPNATPLNKPANAKAQVLAGKKMRSTSPATPKAAKTTSTTVKESPKASTPADDDKLSPSVDVDDFETMPTFTIVNINDIINKKGDVLISKTAGAKNAATAGGKTQRSESPKPTPKTDKRASPSSGTASTTTSESKLCRRKASHTILSEKMNLEHPKTAAKTRSPIAPSSKKPTQTILNHSLANKSAVTIERPKRGAGGNSKANTAGDISPGKPAPRILNATVAKKTQPVKPMIANLDDSADDSFPLSLDEDEEEEEEINDDDPEYEESEPETDSESELPSSATYSNRRKTTKSKGSSNQPATKENSLAANNRMAPAAKSKSKASPATQQRKQTPPEKVVISRQGDKIIKKITCFETWYVINMPEERPMKILRNQLEIPLIKLANVSKDIRLPSDAWSSKVTLYELSATTIAKSTLITYTGALREHNITEEDRGKYQPSCVMFRRAVNDRTKSRLPYDRAVIFKNKTFFTNIEGKNVKMVGAPALINSEAEVEILLQIVDSLTLQSVFVEPATTVQ